VEMPSVVFLMAEDVSKVTFQLCAGADISTLPPQIIAKLQRCIYTTDGMIGCPALHRPPFSSYKL
ncbi:hypothetical protein, partial [Sinorhizobium medicae]|uniref:hypothetical protein n=1 Tax=Sinorhizobium medicae TaxID=110321 RepID=UPI001AECAEC0